jgi:propanol-preferring alcohol dehydrogenase
MPDTMTAMVLERQRELLVRRLVDRPEAGSGQVLVRVLVCGVCRTDLHVVDGDLTEPNLPLIPGHQIVGIVEEVGDAVQDISRGDRVGIPWLGGTCGACFYCRNGQENLCDEALFTGYQINGGYAEFAVANAEYCFPIPDSYDDAQAAPLLCAGLIGYRSYRMAEKAMEVAGRRPRLGLYGFGAAAHIIAQIALHEKKDVFAFVRPGDERSAQFARDLGASWSGESGAAPPKDLDAAIIFAPVGPLVPAALRALRKGGRVVCAGIHMSDIPTFPYRDLWGERSIVSVANLTRQDGIEFFEVARTVPITTTVTEFPLRQANEALDALRGGRFEGAAVLNVRQRAG